MRKKRKQHSHVPGTQRYTIHDFRAQFPSEDACLDHIMQGRWPNGVLRCDSKDCLGVDRKHHRVSGRTAYACDSCGNHVFPLAGTIFEKTTTPLEFWFYAIHLIASTRCGISAKHLQRELGVTYKTAWRMFHKIRTLMSEDITLGPKPVEMDECYVGGRRHRGNGRGRGVASEDTKTPVFGMVERKGRVLAFVTPNAKAKTVLPIVKERVLPKNMVYTDDYVIYDKVPWMGQSYRHRRINHSQGLYVMGDIHTNSIEGFWSLIKRGISGVYHSVSRKYLQSYLDEYSFRYNRRNDEQPMFTSLLAQVCLKAA